MKDNAKQAEIGDLWQTWVLELKSRGLNKERVNGRWIDCSWILGKTDLFFHFVSSFCNRNRQVEAGIDLVFSNRISDRKEGSVAIPTSGAELLCPSSPEQEKGIAASFALPLCHAASCQRLSSQSSSPPVKSVSALSEKTIAGKAKTGKYGSLQGNRLGFLGSHDPGEEDRSCPTAARASCYCSLPQPIACIGEGEEKKSCSRVSVM
ncbi:hypothetical protein MRB53_016905 [Persea americana]|uniref:Uncharacterized protein n=1 Tax=Persea americana TaxID=3435 RepID=A0ACC2M372_PERAE|nr:hypothetical protein MRB53_016905 [Persea americana]